MPIQSQKTTQSAPIITNETILVVPRKKLFESSEFQGIQTQNLNNYLSIIKKHQTFLPRTAMEEDENYKQIIPYLIFKHMDKYFLMQRAAKASEQRLKSKYTLGIGGHIRKADMVSDSIFDWAQREFYEEVNYSGTLSISPLGLVNDDSNAVGKVHIGLVLLLEGDSANISVKTELAGGQMLTLQDCKNYYKRMESWSRLVFDYLTN